jgi:hypothetical protein
MFSPSFHKKSYSLVPVAHACNPSYSGGRQQEDCSSKPAWANSLQDPISKKHFTKKGWWSGSRCKPWVQTSVLQKKRVINIIDHQSLPSRNKSWGLSHLQVFPEPIPSRATTIFTSYSQ